jgi:hypothetical protein
VIYVTGFSPVQARPVAGSLSLEKPYHPEDIIKIVKEMRRESRAPISSGSSACG